MKATNIFHSLKSKGVCGTDGIPPKLPGVSSPLDKKLTGKQKNLNPGLRAAIEAAPESPANYGTSAAPTKLNDDPKYGKLIRKKDLGGGKTEYLYDVGSNMPKKVTTYTKTKESPESESPTPLKKKSCGSPATFNPEEAEKKPRTRRPGRTRRRVTAMLRGLANSGRGCKRNPYGI